MSELNDDLRKKVVVVNKHVAMCSMNLCTRGGQPVIIALEDSEGIANQKAEAHRNDHRDHEKHAEAVLARSRAGRGMGQAVVEAKADEELEAALRAERSGDEVQR